MSKINFSHLFEEMLQAFESTFKATGNKMLPETKAALQTALRQMMQRLENIAELSIKGAIDKKDAEALFLIQKQAAEIELLTIAGISVIVIQNSMNAALDVVKKIVNRAIGWKLL